MASVTPTPAGKIWRYQDGALPNLLALGYILLGHISGLALLTAANPVSYIVGILLTAHSLVVAGYMIHELAHQLVFRDRHLTGLVGEFMAWLCGAAYAPFRRIQLMHMRHHGDRTDIALFDHQVFLKRCPGAVHRLVYALEWLHIPAVEIIMHYQILVRPFINPEWQNERPRVVIVAISRGIFFWLLLFIGGPLTLAGYTIAWLLFIKVLFLADAYAHTYTSYIISRPDEPVPQEGRDARYDKEHTYSNLISTRWPWLNMLNLNFGYHTAHHDRPSTPWYRLPALHYETYTKDAPQILAYRDLLYSIHHNRLKCIIADDYGNVVGTGKDRADGFLGVHGVSFLSIV